MARRTATTTTRCDDKCPGSFSAPERLSSDDLEGGYIEQQQLGSFRLLAGSIGTAE